MGSVWGTIPQWISALAALAAILIAWQQVSNIIKNNAIKMILDIEKDLHDRKSKIDDITSNIRQNETSDKMIEIFKDDLTAAKEAYFDVLDRLCYCILKKYIQDTDWKEEYRALVGEAVRENKEDFQIGTYYNNILKIYRKWYE